MKLLLLVPLLLALANGSEPGTAENRGFVRRGNRRLNFFNGLWNTLGEMRENWATQRRWIKPTQVQEKYDIVIIGAGMAGLAAAKEIQDIDPDLSYIILESTSAVGGRVRSTTFGAVGNKVVIEDGANWLYSNNNYPTWNLANEQGIQRTLSDYSDFTMYDESVSQATRGLNPRG